MLRLGLRPQPRSSPPRWIAPKQVLELAQARKTYNSNSGIARDAVPTERENSKSTPDATHRALGLNEIRFADVMAFLLVPDDFLKALPDGFIRSAAAQQRFQVRLG